MTLKASSATCVVVASGIGWALGLSSGPSVQNSVHVAWASSEHGEWVLREQHGNAWHFDTVLVTSATF